GSPLLASFLARPELAALCPVASATFLLNGLALQHRALLQRGMQFGTQASIDLAAAVLGGLTASLMAWEGLGYWSLPRQTLATDACSLLLLTRASRFRPGRPAMTAEVRDLLRFGGSLFGFNLLGGVAQNLYIALLGRNAGAAAAGLYTRGFSLATIVQAIV